MPLTSAAADALGVVTICLVAILILFGLVCIAYSFYFRSRVRSQGFSQLSYFSGPWIIRLTVILFVIWWGVGEIIRLSLLRRKGRVLDALDYKWQETVCKGYIVSNLGFAEPCLLLTIIFLLRAPLQKMESGVLCRRWNGKTAACVLLYCLPMFVLQLTVIVIGPRLRKDKSRLERLPHYFTVTATHGLQNATSDTALCTYPLLNIILLGVFASALTVYLFWIGRRILKLVINKGLKKRVYTLIFSVSSFLPLRVLLLGLSVLSKPEHFLFEALAFSAFLALSCCAGVCICMLVYYPVADSLALGDPRDLEARRRYAADEHETISLVANQSHLEESGQMSPGRNSDASMKRGSISFRTYHRDGTSSGPFVELSLFSPSPDATPPGSPPPLGWPMRPLVDPENRARNRVLVVNINFVKKKN
ncbi:PLASMINOGEN ACTIVATOR INHIBITOR [Salix viminalis]|uniref:PLASMINOGEN ACTIVATOR INHIBITOR n=1 Tax=Salix viminalis TaxID=40686 RepID=A0A9Q0TPP5_SALVM|nr:PLASMINOGEN ACTIVATOR INHIBITOR [Salix viminalis]